MDRDKNVCADTRYFSFEFVSRAIQGVVLACFPLGVVFDEPDLFETALAPSSASTATETLLKRGEVGASEGDWGRDVVRESTGAA